LFAGLPAAELDELANAAHFVQLEAGQLLFVKDEPGHQLYVVSRGVIRISSNSLDGKETILNLLRAGQMFGEVAVLDGQDRTSNATAHEATELLVLERRDLMGFLERNPEAMRRMLVAVCARLRWISEALEDAHFLDLPRRLAKRILLLAQLFGHRHSSGGIRIAVQLSQQDLAELLVVTRESVNRQMRLWEADGILSLSGGYLLVTDIERLERIL
jgi:CRP-like cAMP-binding protein